MQGILEDLGDQPARGDHPHRGEGSLQEVPGGGEEEIPGRTAEVPCPSFFFCILNVLASYVQYCTNIFKNRSENS